MSALFPIYDENRPATKPYVNYILISVNILVFFIFFGGGLETLRAGIISLGVRPVYILHGERLWTLFTSMFMHADLMHLLGNMLYLWIFGDNVEDDLGHIKYILFYFSGGLIASFTHIASVLIALPTVGPSGLILPSVGASGAISAVLGAYLILYPRARIRTVIFYFFIQIISVPAYYYLGFWFLYQLLMGVISLTGFSSGVAFWAHIGGFVAGVSMIKALGVKAKPKRKVSIIVRRPVKPPYYEPWVRVPFMDVIVEPDRVRIIAELPGVDPENISVNATSWSVAIAADRGDMRFYRHIPLPVPVIPKVEELTYRNGVLSFVLYRSIL